MIKKQKTNRAVKKTQPLKKGLNTKVITVVLLLLGLFVLLVLLQQRQDLRSKAAPSAQLQTDRTNLSFTANGYTSEYHLYAAGLDWTKPVGLLMYTDGSGESGLKNPSGTHLLAGSKGMIAIAKKHNMVLVTPFSPNKGCEGGTESCWYEGDSPGYAKWAEALIASIESQYQIDKRRVAVGGYSSGATFTTGWFVPSGGAQRIMDDGVIVAISYGGPAYMDEVAYTAAFKSNVHMNWNVGDQDESLSDVKEGHQHYTQAGFQTSLDILPGVDHDRSQQFGTIMDAQITKHVIPATGAVPTTATQPTGEVSPTYVCVGSGSCVPSGSPEPTMPEDENPLDPETTPIYDAEPSEDPYYEDTLSPFPTLDPNSPQPAPGNGGNRQGIIGLLLAFIMLILQFFASLFGR